MKKVYYQGKPYTYKVMGDVIGERQYSLYNNDGLLVHFVNENQLDKPKLLNTIVQAYYRTIMEDQPAMIG